MKKRICVMICLLASAAMVATGCGKKEEAEKTTWMGMVTAIDGDEITFMGSKMTGEEGEFSKDGQGRPDMNVSGGALENMTPPSGMPEGGERPEGMTPPSGMPDMENGEMPQMPEGMTPPSGIPESGDKNDSGNGRGNGGMGMMQNGEEKTITISDETKITVVTQDGESEGTIEDITESSMITVEMEGENIVSISVQEGFQRGFGGGNRPQMPQQKENENTAGTTV